MTATHPTGVTSLGFLGLAGAPVALTSTWVVLGSRRSGYSPLRDPVSRMAAVGADRRGAMTAGFLAYAFGAGCGAAALRRMPDGAELLVHPPSVAASGLGMLGLAVFPLGASFGDAPHLVAGTATYAALSVAPLVPAAGFWKSGRRFMAGAAVTAAIVTAAAFGLSRAVPARQGLFQRIGLLSSGAWTASAGLAALRASRAVAGRG